MKKRDIEDVKTEGTMKNEDEDAMDIEPTSTQPPLKDPIKHTNEHPSRQPTPASIDKKEAEDAPYVH